MTNQQLKPAIEPRRHRYPIEYDRISNYREPKAVPIWVGVAAVGWMWIMGAVFL